MENDQISGFGVVRVAHGSGLLYVKSRLLKTAESEDWENNKRPGTYLDSTDV